MKILSRLGLVCFCLSLAAAEVDQDSLATMIVQSSQDQAVANEQVVMAQKELVEKNNTTSSPADYKSQPTKEFSVDAILDQGFAPNKALSALNNPGIVPPGVSPRGFLPNHRNNAPDRSLERAEYHDRFDSNVSRPPFPPRRIGLRSRQKNGIRPLISFVAVAPGAFEGHGSRVEPTPQIVAEHFARALGFNDLDQIKTTLAEYDKRAASSQKTINNLTDRVNTLMERLTALEARNQSASLAQKK